MLPLGYIARTPHLAKAGKDKIHGIGTENTVDKHIERGLDAKGTQLYTPSHSPYHMRKHSESQARSDPSEIALRTYDIQHLTEIYACKKEIAQPDADYQRDYIFHNLTQARAFLLVHINCV